MELQQIIEGLNCFKTNQHPCTTCPWNPNPGMAWPYGCIKGQSDIIDAAQEQLRKISGDSDGMKIIKEGDISRLNKTKRFECERCGCVFDASAAEYKDVFDRNDTYSCCICPICGMKVIAW